MWMRKHEEGAEIDVRLRQVRVVVAAERLVHAPIAVSTFCCEIFHRSRSPLLASKFSSLQQLSLSRVEGKQ